MSDVSPEHEAYHKLCSYTIEHARRDPAFIHQHVVDAFAAQHADDGSKPIGVAFALIGLFLHVEKQFSGAQVQRVHMQLGQHKRGWPWFALRAHRGAMTAIDVMAAPPGPNRDRAIDAWCASVWQAYAGQRVAVIDLMKEHGIAEVGPRGLR